MTTESIYHRQCEAREKRRQCPNEAIGKAIDQYGANYYCGKHLAKIEQLNDVSIRIVKFKKME